MFLLYRILAAVIVLLLPLLLLAQGTDYVIAIPENDGHSSTPSVIEISISTKADAASVTVVLPDGSTREYRVVADRLTTLTTENGGASAAWEIPWSASEQVLDRTVRITSDQPITVYVMHSKGFSSDGYRAIPVRNWGRNYVVTSYYDFADGKPWAGGFSVMAAEDNTKVSILLRGATNGTARTKGGRALNTGATYSVVLKKGQVYTVFGDATTRGVFDMTGTLVTSDKPVGVIGFHTRSAVPNSLTISGRDHLVEMLPPTSTWGTRAVTLEIPRLSTGTGRGDFFRVVASENATRWKMTSFDKVTYDTLEQKSGILNAGQFAELTQASARTALPRGITVWEADKPIQVMQYSTSAEWDGDVNNDPFMCLVAPTTQFVTEATVHTSTLPAFTEHRINLFVQIPDTNNPAADLMSLAVNGQTVWDHPRAEVPRLMQTKNPSLQALYYATIVVDPSATPYRISGNGRVRFAGYVYGSGNLDSYAWPVTSAMRVLPAIDTMPPRLSVTSAQCSSVNVTVLETRNIPDPPRPRPLATDQVDAGLYSIRLAEGSTNCSLTLLTAADVHNPFSTYKQFDVRVRSVDVNQEAVAIIQAIDDAANEALDTIVIPPAVLQASTPETDFGRVRVETPQQRTVVLRNVATDPITVTNAVTSTAVCSVELVVPPLPATIQPGDSVSVVVGYTARGETEDLLDGWVLDTLIVTTSACPVRHPMRGMGVVSRINVLDVLLDTVDVGGVICSTLGMSITNAVGSVPGTDTLIVTGIRSVDAPFFISDPPEPPLPLTIAPGTTAYLGRICVRGEGNGLVRGDVVVESNAYEGDAVSSVSATVRGGVHVSDESRFANIVTTTPHPVQGALQVRWATPLAADAVVVLMDVGGRTVATAAPRSGASGVEVNCSDLAPGAYVLRIMVPGSLPMHRPVMVVD